MLRAAFVPLALTLLVGLVLPAGRVTAASAGAAAAGGFSVATAFSDHAILQRDRPVSIWGNAAPGEKVTVSFADARHAAVAGTDGRWEAVLAPMPASADPRDLLIRGAGDHPLIREFKVAAQSSLIPLQDVSGKWSCSTPEPAGRP